MGMGMSIALAALAGLNIALAFWLWRRQCALQDLLRRATERQDALGADLGLNPPRTPADGPLISVTVLNPMELAKQQSSLARAFGDLTPRLVEREVYREVHRQLSEQLRSQGVVAEVTLHGDA